MAAEEDSNSNSNTKKESYNIFRDSPLRYAGYANEVGESFRYQFPKLVAPSYVISFGYCFADAASTGYDTWKEYPNQNNSSTTRETKTALYTMDTLLWQSLASVMIPGATINLIVKASRLAMARSPIALGATVKEWFPTAAGLGSIPLIIHPIDHAVDALLDNTTRLWCAEDKAGGESK